MSVEIIEELVKEWNNSGIFEGDVVLLHSSLKRIYSQFLRKKIRLSTEQILDSFLSAVGASGTLLLPLFNFDFTRGIPFDISKTPSQMGVLTEVARVHPSVIRTGHPIYSFAVIGDKSNLFKSVNNFSGYGEDSPFGMLRELDGKIAVLGLPDQNSMTFYHHVEEMHNVDYRYHKTFSGDYKNASGVTENRTYGLFVRDIERKVLTNVNPMGDMLWQEGLYSGNPYDEGNGLRVISARSLFNFVSGIIESGLAEGLLYSIDGK